jgi:hypothetical protein
MYTNTGDPMAERVANYTTNPGKPWNRRKNSVLFWRKNSWPTPILHLPSKRIDSQDEDISMNDLRKPQMEAVDGDEDKKSVSILLIMSIFLSVFLSALDISIIATALPTMSAHMHAGKGFTWIGSAYLLAGAASEPIWAKASDIFGRRPILICANLVFLFGSILCAMSLSILALITGRVVQGLGSGGILVLANVLIGDLFSPR